MLLLRPVEDLEEKNGERIVRGHVGVSPCPPFAYVMYQLNASVGGTMLHRPAILSRVHDEPFLGLELHPLCEDFLEKFAKAIEQDDRTIGFRKRVVRFIRFGENHRNRLFEQVGEVAQSNTGRVELG